MQLDREINILKGKIVFQILSLHLCFWVTTKNMFNLHNKNDSMKNINNFITYFLAKIKLRMHPKLFMNT